MLGLGLPLMMCSSVHWKFQAASSMKTVSVSCNMSDDPLFSGWDEIVSWPGALSPYGKLWKLRIQSVQLFGGTETTPVFLPTELFKDSS